MGMGYRTLVYAGAPCPSSTQDDGTGIVPHSLSSKPSFAKSVDSVAVSDSRNFHSPLRSSRCASDLCQARGGRPPLPGE